MGTIATDPAYQTSAGSRSGNDIGWLPRNVPARFSVSIDTPKLATKRREVARFATRSRERLHGNPVDQIAVDERSRRQP
jgi:hypothetical protein